MFLQNTWVADSGFGRIRWRVGFGRIRVDSGRCPLRRRIHRDQKFGQIGTILGDFTILDDLGRFWVQSCSCRPNGFRIRTDSVDSRIRTDSDGFQRPKYGMRQPRYFLCSDLQIDGIFVLLFKSTLFKFVWRKDRDMVSTAAFGHGHGHGHGHDRGHITSPTGFGRVKVVSTLGTGRPKPQGPESHRGSRVQYTSDSIDQLAYMRRQI